MSVQIIQIMRNLYQQASVKVNTKNYITKPVEVTLGVLQEDSLSPILFALLLYDIIDLFRKKGFTSHLEQIYYCLRMI